jgi:hypothetical protein
MLLGIMAGAAGIPAAFIVAALVAAIGAGGAALLSAGSVLHDSLEPAEVTLH